MKFKNCLKCGKSVSKNCHLGYCNKCRDRSGKNNSFYGKKHDRAMIERTKKKLSFISKNVWRDPEYRKKVIKGMSKPRNEEFKIEQSKRVTQWYIDNPKQKEIRSKVMKNSWQKNIITKKNFSCNSSKLEKDLFKNIKVIVPDAKKCQIIRDSTNRCIFPDILIESCGIIIEFFGDFWHANPKIYKSYDVIYHNITAKEIWYRDQNRIKRLEYIIDKNSHFAKGYRIFIVWENEYKNDKNFVLKKFDQILNWEYSY